MKSKRIAIINQRYGEEVNGGSEYYTKKLAEHLAPFYDVEVLTTTAKDYDTWKPYYEKGACKIDGVHVLRFPVEKQRGKWKFRIIKLLMLILPKFLTTKLEYCWLVEQGPFCPELIEYIQKERLQYDVFIFVTYLYYSTVMGIKEVLEKAILVPTAHNEYWIHFDIYKEMFTNVKGIAYLTAEEEAFVEGLFNNSNIPHVIAGVGIDSVKGILNKIGEPQTDFPYLIYVGRVDRGKGCHVLFRYFEKYKKRHQGNLKLIVLGKMMLPPPNTEDIICLGFVSEEEKLKWMSKARALILPSRYESLSLSVLEALEMGVPVLVNGRSSVLKGHCIRSGAGYIYENYLEFEKGILDFLNSEEDYQKMKRFGIEYVRKYYDWMRTIKKYEELIEE